MPSEMFVAGNWPVRLIDEQASTKPMSIEPESPMNIRAGKKLCGSTPMQAPARAAVSSAAAMARDSPFSTAST